MQDFFKTIRKNYLLAIVFITGACVLVIEVSATRILSPYFGNTIFSVSSILTVILTALSFGYYIGGIWADKRPSITLFYQLITVSGISVLFLQLLSDIFLPIVGFKLDFKTGSLIASLVLFFTPALFLGMLSPLAIKLQTMLTPKAGIGSVSGKVFFFSTAGSIFGSLLTGFYLIPTFGLKSIILAVGIFLALLGTGGMLLGNKSKKLPYTLFGLIAFLYLGSFIVKSNPTGVVYSDDGVYQKITIADSQRSDKTQRSLFLDRNHSGAIYLNSEELAFEYFKYVDIYKLVKPDLSRVAVVGGGAYVIPKVLVSELSGVVVDVAEIEPGLFALAKDYFVVPDNPRIHNYVGDGRRLLQENEKLYDLIFLDAYSGISTIPSHLTTKEFFDLVKTRLADDGLFIANFIGDLAPVDNSLTFSEIKTIQKVFPNSYFFATESPMRLTAQNMIFVGLKGKDKLGLTDRLREKQITLDPSVLARQKLLTDDYAPVERLVADFIDRLYGGR